MRSEYLLCTHLNSNRYIHACRFQIVWLDFTHTSIDSVPYFQSTSPVLWPFRTSVRLFYRVPFLYLPEKIGLTHSRVNLNSFMKSTWSITLCLDVEWPNFFIFHIVGVNVINTTGTACIQLTMLKSASECLFWYPVSCCRKKLPL